MTQTVLDVPFWTAEAKVPNQYPYLTEDLDCEVAVVGGGITGALCAYALAKAGVNTVLLDSALIGFGATGTASSILQYDIDYDLSSLKDLIGIENAVRAYRACARGLDEIDRLVRELGANVGFSRRDSFYYAQDPCDAHTIKQEYLLRRRHEFPAELLDSARAADRFSFRVEAGIYAPNMAGEVDPYRLTHAVIADAVSAGLRVFENTPVESASPELSGIRLTTHTHHTVTAKKMVNATGLAAAREAGHVVQKRTTFCVVTAPVQGFDGWYNRCVIRDNCPGSVYLRTLPDDRILIGGLDTCFLDVRGALAGILPVHSAANSRFDYLEHRLASMMTGIDGIESEYRFKGATIDTGDGLPYVGERPDCPNVYYTLCGGSNGIVFAQLAADLVRDFYLGGDAADCDLFAFGRL